MKSEIKKYLQTMTYEDFVESFRANPGTLCSDSPNQGDCEMFNAIQILSGKWRMSVIYTLARQDAYRFGELKKAIPGITNTMLTTILRELEEFGIVKRTQFNEIPPHVEYSLTQKGLDLFPAFFEMIKWSAKYSGLK